MDRPTTPDDCEIEVTPEMIEAGADVIYDRFDDVITRPSSAAPDVAIEVFRAMISVHRQIAEMPLPNG